MTKRHSKFAPIFIASTVVFFLGSAYKFIFGDRQDKASTADATVDDLNEDKKENHPQEPEEDPVKSL